MNVEISSARISRGYGMAKNVVAIALSKLWNICDQGKHNICVVPPKFE